MELILSIKTVREGYLHVDILVIQRISQLVELMEKYICTMQLIEITHYSLS